MAARKDLSNQLDGLFEFEPEPRPDEERDAAPDAIAGLIEGQTEIAPAVVAEEEQAGEAPLGEAPAEELPVEALSFETGEAVGPAIAELAVDQLLGAEAEVEEPLAAQPAEAEAETAPADVSSAEVLAELGDVEYGPPVEEPIIGDKGPIVSVSEVSEPLPKAPAVEPVEADVEAEAEAGIPPIDVPVAQAPAVTETVWESPVIAETETVAMAPETEPEADEPPVDAPVAESPVVAETVWESPIVDETEPATTILEATSEEAEPVVETAAFEPAEPEVEARVDAEAVWEGPPTAEIEPAIVPPEVKPAAGAPSPGALSIDDLDIIESVWGGPTVAPAVPEMEAEAEAEVSIPLVDEPLTEAPPVAETAWEEPVLAETAPRVAAPEATSEVVEMAWEPPSFESPEIESIWEEPVGAPAVAETVWEEPVAAETAPSVTAPEDTSEVIETAWEESSFEPPEVESVWEEPVAAETVPSVTAQEVTPEAAETAWEPSAVEPAASEVETGTDLAPAPSAEAPIIDETVLESPAISEPEPAVTASQPVEPGWDMPEFEPAAAEAIWEEPPEEPMAAEAEVLPTGEALGFEPAWEEPVAAEAAEPDWEIPTFEQAVAEAGEALGVQQVWEEPASEPVAAEAIWETPIVAEPDTEEPVWDESVVAEVVAEVVERDTREAPVDEAPDEVLSVADLAVTEPELAEAAAAVLPVDLPPVDVVPTEAPPVEEPIAEEPAIVEPTVAEAAVAPTDVVSAPPLDKSTTELPPLGTPPVAAPSDGELAAEEAAVPKWALFLEVERLKILNMLLGIVTLASTALIMLFVYRIAHQPSELGSHIPYFIAYVLLLVVTFFPQLPWKLRAGIPIALFYAVGVFSTLNRGVLGPADLYLVVAPLVIAVLFGHREGVISAVGSSILYGGLVFAQSQGWFAPDPDLVYKLAEPDYMLNLIISFVMLVAVAALMLWRSRSGLIGALREAEDRRAETARSQALLREHAEELAETNVLLERRSIQLETASDLAHSAVADLDLDEWMHQAVNLICQRFNLYHVGLYLLDEDKARAVIKAGTGESGARMLAQEYGCEAGGDTAIGRSVAEERPCIARDVSSAGDSEVSNGVGSIVGFGEIHSLLPATRSEIALPLQSHGQVLGALDVHSMVQRAFSEEEIAALRTLADQMAVAIHDAKLFVELRQRLQEMEAAQRLYVREQFADFATRQGAPFHQRTRPGTTPLVDAVPPEVENAVAKGEMVVQPGTGDGAAEAALVAPIQLRGEIIGALGLQEIADEKIWTRDEVALVEAVADQMALAIENIRLLDETRQRAQRDRLIADITAQVRASMDVERILQTAVRGLGTALGTNRAYIRLGAPSSEDGATRPLDVEALPGGSGGNGRVDEEQDQGDEEPSAESVSLMQDEPVTDEASAEAL